MSKKKHLQHSQLQRGSQLGSCLFAQTKMPSIEVQKATVTIDEANASGTCPYLGGYGHNAASFIDSNPEESSENEAVVMKFTAPFLVLAANITSYVWWRAEAQGRKHTCSSSHC